MDSGERSLALGAEPGFVAAVLDTIAALVIVVDPKGRIVRFNRACEVLTGYTFNQVRGRPFFDIFLLPEESNRVRARFAALVSGHRPDTTEHHWVTSAAGRRLISWTYSALTGASGAADFVIATGIDVTDRRQTEARIARMNQAFLGFGTDPGKNIGRLTTLLGQLLSPSFAIYSRLEHEHLCAVGRWHAPLDLDAVDPCEGRIEADLLRDEKEDVVHIRRLSTTPYASSDPKVGRLKLEAFLGQAVRCRGDHVGVIGAFFHSDYEPTEEDCRVLGMIAGAIGIEEDRLRAERALRASQEQYRALVESVRVIPWTLELPSLRMTYVGPQARAILGYPAEDWLADGFWLAHLHPADRDAASQLRAAATARSEDHEFEYRMIAADGRVVWFRDIVHVVRGDGGAVGLRGFLVDITQRKNAEEAWEKAEEALRDQTRVLHSILNSMADGVVVTDLKGKLILANAAAGRLFGHGLERDGSPGELWSALAMLRPDQTTPVPYDELPLVRAIRGEATDQVELFLRNAGAGEGIFLSASGRCVHDDSGAPIGGAVVFEDVTARKRAARALEDAETQLRHAQKMEAVGRLAGGVAHDFNNILTAITGHALLLLDRLSPENPARHDVDSIRTAAERAAALTRQLLAFSRKQVLKSCVIDLNGVVSGMNSMLRRLIGEDVELAMELAPDLGRVRADPGQIEQVIMNLAVNARDAMPDGGRLLIRTENVARNLNGARDVNAPRVLIAIRDTGSGMEPETLAHLFEPFFTTKEMGKGTGLGLSTAYGIVRQSGGTIAVESEPRRGTTFTIYLPRVPDAAEPAASRERDGGIAGGAETVLVVEDEAPLRDLVTTILKRRGYRILATANGPDALEVCEKQGRIDLLLTDVVMPQMSGRELARRLALLQPGMRILYMSGYTDDAIAQHGVLEVGTNLLEKPFTPDALVRRVREVLDSERRTG